MAPICTFILLLVAVMMNNFGIKLIDMNRQANEDLSLAINKPGV
jgi:hypothetical protein